MTNQWTTEIRFSKEGCSSTLNLPNKRIRMITERKENLDQSSVIIFQPVEIISIYLISFLVYFDLLNRFLALCMK